MKTQSATKKITFEQMPILISQLIAEIGEVKQMFKVLETRIKLSKDKGEMVKGFTAIGKRWKISNETIAKLIKQGAPIHKVANSYRTYTKELDTYLSN